MFCPERFGCQHNPAGLASQLRSRSFRPMHGTLQSDSSLHIFLQHAVLICPYFCGCQFNPAGMASRCAHSNFRLMHGALRKTSGRVLTSCQTAICAPSAAAHTQPHCPHQPTGILKVLIRPCADLSTNNFAANPLLQVWQPNCAHSSSKPTHGTLPKAFGQVLMTSQTAACTTSCSKPCPSSLPSQGWRCSS